MPLFDPIWFSVFSVCISMTHGQCQNDGTCVPDELSPDKTPAEEKGTEALWDKSRVKDGANADRLLVHTQHPHTLQLWYQSPHTHHTPCCTTNHLCDIFRRLLALCFLPFNSSYNNIPADKCQAKASGGNCYSLLYYLNSTCRLSNTSQCAPPHSLKHTVEPFNPQAS